MEWKLFFYGKVLDSDGLTSTVRGRSARNKYEPGGSSIVCYMSILGFIYSFYYSECALKILGDLVYCVSEVKSLRKLTL